VATPGKLTAFQSYNDQYRGWPIAPVKRQHPIRGSFLDPRPDPRLGAIYHDGVDIAVREDRPERGAPKGRTHRVYAIEGGEVWDATPSGVGGRVRAGHFGYGHIDARVKVGDRVRAGQMIGWTVRGHWHVHLTEFIFTAGGGRLQVNPLRRGGKLSPYVDKAAPRVYEIRFYRPATPKWGRRGKISVARFPQAGTRLNKSALAGIVDLRARISDPQSFIGWFKDHPHLAAPHHPYRLGLVVVSLKTGRAVIRREVFWSEQLIDVPAGQHYAPGTEQNLPASGCQLFHRQIACDGTYWFRVFQKPYWDTRKLPDGRYRLAIRAWDVAGNRALAKTDVTIANAV
jgi:hypothetical protein